MMPIRRLYLSLLAIFLAGSVLLYFTRQSTDPSDTSLASEIQTTIRSPHAESNPARLGIFPDVTVDIGQKKTPTTPSIGRSLDWNKYPGTLDSQIHRVLDSHNGEMALDVAAKLWNCKFVAGVLDSAYASQKSSSEDMARQESRLRVIQNTQRENADCQTVAGDRDQWRLRVLDVAIEQKMAGAAIESFNQGVRRPEVIQRVVQDAQAGDINSLTNVAYHKAATFDISADTQRAIRYALVLASQDPVVGKMVHPYLNIAETTSVPVGGEAKPKFDDANLSDDMRKEANAIAERLVSRIKRGGQ
jgi:hypothetical protein